MMQANVQYYDILQMRLQISPLRPSSIAMALYETGISTLSQLPVSLLC